jgi:hypothetical protein
MVPSTILRGFEMTEKPAANRDEAIKALDEHWVYNAAALFSGPMA